MSEVGQNVVGWGKSAVKSIFPSIYFCGLGEKSDFVRGEFQVVVSQSRQNQFPVLDGLINSVSPLLGYRHERFRRFLKLCGHLEHVLGARLTLLQSSVGLGLLG